MKALSSESRLTANMLVLELSTMIVAIALAFNAESLKASRLTWTSLVNFVIVNIVVIWFWWRYVVERLGNPPRRNEFPVLDVIILILISVLPVVLRLGNLTYIAGVLAAIAFSWSGMGRLGLSRAHDRKELSSGRGASSCAALRRTPRGPCRLLLLS